MYLSEGRLESEGIIGLGAFIFMMIASHFRNGFIQEQKGEKSSNHTYDFDGFCPYYRICSYHYLLKKILACWIFAIHPKSNDLRSLMF